MTHKPRTNMLLGTARVLLQVGAQNAATAPRAHTAATDAEQAIRDDERKCIIRELEARGYFNCASVVQENLK